MATTDRRITTLPEHPQVELRPERPSGLHHWLAYGLSFPERSVRWLASLAGSMLLMLTFLLPRPVREGRFFKIAVQRQIKMLLDDVGQAGVFQDQEELDAKTAARLGVGGAVDNLLILTLHASPIWLLLAATDVCQGAATFVSEVGQELKDAGVMEDGSRLDSVDDVLHGLARLSRRMADTVDMPPISLDDMKQTVQHLRNEVTGVTGTVVDAADLDGLVRDVTSVARESDRSLLSVSAAVATGAFQKTSNAILGTAIGTTATLRFVGRSLGDVLGDYGRSANKLRRLGFYGSLRRFLRPQTRASKRLFAYPFITFTEIGLSFGRWRKAPWRR